SSQLRVIKTFQPVLTDDVTHAPFRMPVQLRLGNLPAIAKHVREKFALRIISADVRHDIDAFQEELLLVELADDADVEVGVDYDRQHAVGQLGRLEPIVKFVVVYVENFG